MGGDVERVVLERCERKVTSLGSPRLGQHLAADLQHRVRLSHDLQPPDRIVHEAVDGQEGENGVGQWGRPPRPAETRERAVVVNPARQLKRLDVVAGLDSSGDPRTRAGDIGAAVNAVRAVRPWSLSRRNVALDVDLPSALSRDARVMPRLHQDGSAVTVSHDEKDTRVRWRYGAPHCKSVLADWECVPCLD